MASAKGYRIDRLRRELMSVMQSEIISRVEDVICSVNDWTEDSIIVLVAVEETPA